MAVIGTSSPASTSPSSHPIVISRARRARSLLWWSLSSLGLALLALPVVWILIEVIAKGVSVWNWGVLVHTTSGVGGYGLANAIVGTLMLTVGVAIVAGLVGISGGIYLAEFAGDSKFATVLRSASEVLSGIPSIVFGFCGYLTLVLGLGWNFSYLPAVIVLSMLVVPYIVKATELALNQVPAAYREGAEGLGMSKVYLLRKIVLRSGLPGILTGLIIALAISVGETAPLLYTAGFTNAFPSFSLIGNRASGNPLGYLTYAAYEFIDSTVPAQKNLAYDAALILVVMVLALILSARLIVWLSQKYSPNRAVARPNREMRRKTRELAAGKATAELGRGRSAD
jgi:phosphate transport system permease protein